MQGFVNPAPLPALFSNLCSSLPPATPPPPLHPYHLSLFVASSAAAVCPFPLRNPSIPLQLFDLFGETDARTGEEVWVVGGEGSRPGM